MSKWQIVEQVEKRGKVEFPVKVKHVRFFPMMEKGQIKGFGRLGFTVLKMLLTDGSGDGEYALSWSGARGGAGTFKWQRPGKMDYGFERDCETNRICKDRKGNPIVDFLGGKTVYYPGEADTFESHEALAKFLVQRVGPAMTVEILNLFAAKLVEVNSKVAKKAAA